MKKNLIDQNKNSSETKAYNKEAVIIVVVVLLAILFLIINANGGVSALYGKIMSITQGTIQEEKDTKSSTVIDKKSITTTDNSSKKIITETSKDTNATKSVPQSTGGSSTTTNTTQQQSGSSNETKSSSSYAPSCSDSLLSSSKSYLLTLKTTGINSISIDMNGYFVTHPGSAWGDPAVDAYYAQIKELKNKWIIMELDRLNAQNAQYNCPSIPNVYLI